MKKVNITVLLLFLISHINAQERSSKGYIITHKLDTIYGYINEGTDIQLTSYILFSETKESNELKYLASELVGFEFDYGRSFTSFVIRHDSSTSNTNLFVKQLVDGGISIFARPIKQNHHPDFILINNLTLDTIQITEPKKITIERNGKEYFSTTNNHITSINQLKGIPKNEYVSKIWYSERSIIKDILSFNETYTDQYPLIVYQRKLTYFNDLSIGLPITGGYSANEIAFRVSYFRKKYSHEETTSLSIIRGMSYRYWENAKSRIDSSIQNSNQNYRQQFISFIPVGLNLHFNSGLLIPYIYGGVGIALLINTNHYVVDFENLGSRNEYLILPTINVGAGVKIKTKSGAFFIEVTPTGNGSGFFANVGYSF